MRARKTVAALLALLLVPSLAACTPNNEAVGDTQSVETNTVHDSADHPGMTIGVVAAGDAGLDQQVLAACHQSKIDAVYASAGEEESPVHSANNGVRGFVSRHVKVMVIAGLHTDKAGISDWSPALEQARKGGVPVVLLDPQGARPEPTLYAAELRSPSNASHMAGSSAKSDENHSKRFIDALDLVVNDNPHPKVMNITWKPYDTPQQ